MAIRTVDLQSFGATVSAQGITLVSCWAPWCATCEAFRPVYHGASERHSEHLFTRLDTQAESLDMKLVRAEIEAETAGAA